MALSKEQLNYFAKFIEKELGIVYSETNEYQLRSRLSEIQTLIGLSSEEELYHKAVTGGIDGQFRELLLDLATNNETSFFRDPNLFRAIETVLLPKTLEAKGGLPIRVWCAATSTGQEPYTLAMIFAEARARGLNAQLDFLGTDISGRVLERSKQGLYSQLEVQRGLPVTLMLKYFEKVEQGPNGQTPGWQLKASIKQGMKFSKLNLLEEWGPRHGPFDWVFCRNVLIYQNVENKKLVLKKIHQSLSPGGVLILGAAESLVGLSDGFDPVQIDSAFVYRKK
jgi:chemotaxis protein methyltransferase CheR